MERGEHEIGPRAQEPVAEWRVVDTIGHLTEVATYRFPASSQRAETKPLIYASDREVWRTIIKGTDATENRRVELRGFWLTEWMPLRPGLFHTQEAQMARDMALLNSQVLPGDETAPPLLLNSRHSRRGRDHTRLFNPHGKMSMVDGGIGCVRLKPMPNRRSHRWAFGASSSGIAHEGVPVALDDADRDRLISDIRRFGGLRCTINGTLRFVPRDDYTEPMFGRGIPQLYIEVDKVDPEPPRRVGRKRLDVTAAVTFLTRDKHYPGLNVSYVTFDPGRDGGLEASAEWLNKVYVRQSYQGRILTDFDEQTRHFEQASFSLHKLLNGLVSRDDAIEIDSELRSGNRVVELLDRRNAFVPGGIHIYGDGYLVQNAAAVGPNATATNIRFTINEQPADE